MKVCGDSDERTTPAGNRYWKHRNESHFIFILLLTDHHIVPGYMNLLDKTTH